jgi:carboxyl-terminal processing protease
LGQVFAKIRICVIVWMVTSMVASSHAAEQFSNPPPMVIALRSQIRGSIRVTNRRLPGFELFDQAMRLTRKYYADPVNEREVLEGTLAAIAMGLPPQCVEDVGDVTHCSGDPQACFKEALHRIATRCGIRTDRLVVRAVNIFMQSLDANSNLLDPAALKELEIGASGKFGGVGMVVNPKDDDYVVISPFEGTPAAKAGIKAGDIIMEIDGQSLHGLPLTEVLRKVRGPAGSTISVTIREPKSGVIRRIRMRRKIIRIPPVRYTMITPTIAYMRIRNFQESARRDSEAALGRISATARGDLQGLILDLRNNPGGLFDEAIGVADLFIRSGKITSVVGRNSGFNRVFSADGKARFRMPKTVVLINRGTASASEILTGALQGRPNVAVMGERSFGKASVQAIFPLHKGMALRITTAHYYTADGRNIDGKGLKPDIVLKQEPDEILERLDVLSKKQLTDDPWIRRALEYLADDSERSPFSHEPLF